MNVGDRLKKLRKSFGLTQKQFASRIPGKIDHTYIGKIERGYQYPSLRMLEKIGRAYNVPLGYFFREGKKRMMSYVEVLDWLTKYEDRAEATAEERLKQRKYMMYGYWKAIAVEVRKMKREFGKLSQEESDENI